MQFQEQTSTQISSVQPLNLRIDSSLQHPLSDCETQIRQQGTDIQSHHCCDSRSQELDSEIQDFVILLDNGQYLHDAFDILNDLIFHQILKLK